MKNQLRIIGGQWKRRQLEFASVEGLRPTPDRIRETVFNWLMWDITQAHVLDVCAGSGAFAFEALSRGAAHVTLIEPNKIQANYLKKNIKLLQAEQCNLHVALAQHVLPKIHQQFDIIFLDPPYSLNLWHELAELIDPLLKINGLIYIEANQDLMLLSLPKSWQKIKSTQAGTVYAGLYQKVVIE